MAKKEVIKNGIPQKALSGRKLPDLQTWRGHQVQKLRHGTTRWLPTLKCYGNIRVTHTQGTPERGCPFYGLL